MNFDFDSIKSSSRPSKGLDLGLSKDSVIKKILNAIGDIVRAGDTELNKKFFEPLAESPYIALKGNQIDFSFKDYLHPRVIWPGDPASCIEFGKDDDLDLAINLLKSYHMRLNNSWLPVFNLIYNDSYNRKAFETYLNILDGFESIETLTIPYIDPRLNTTSSLEESIPLINYKERISDLSKKTKIFYIGTNIEENIEIHSDFLILSSIYLKKTAKIPINHAKRIYIDSDSSSVRRIMDFINRLKTSCLEPNITICIEGISNDSNKKFIKDIFKNSTRFDLKVDYGDIYKTRIGKFIRSLEIAHYEI